MKYYWGLEEAKQELQRRQRDDKLREKAESILKDCPLPEGQYGFLARHVASARFEDVQFQTRCRESGLKAIWLEFSEDKFVTVNPSKMRLIKIRVYCGKGKRGGDKLISGYLVDPRKLNFLNGVPMNRIYCKNGEPLTKVHREMRNSLGLNNGNVLDISKWLKSIGPAKQYYPKFFMALTHRGILFESFESPGFPTLDKFNEEVVIPAIEETIEKLGVEPLIVYHPTCISSEEEAKILNYYPKEVLSYLNTQGLI